jgi:hypothetical protein
MIKNTSVNYVLIATSAVCSLTLHFKMCKVNHSLPLYLCSEIHLLTLPPQTLLSHCLNDLLMWRNPKKAYLVLFECEPYSVISGSRFKPTLDRLPYSILGQDALTSTCFAT